MQIDNKALLAHLAGRGTLVVPSSQRAAAVRFAHARAALAGGERIWETPDVLPWNAWLQREAARGAGRASRAWHLNPAEEWWLWREAVREACAGSSLLQPESLAAPVRNAAALLEEWGIALRSAPTEEAEVLLQARALFGARCASLGAVPPGVAALPPPVDGPLLTLAGFDALGPARRSALKARAARFHIPVALAPAPTVHWAAHDTEDELLAAALWARAQLERDPAARVLILLPDLDQRSAALRHEPRRDGSGPGLRRLVFFPDRTVRCRALPGARAQHEAAISHMALHPGPVAMLELPDRQRVQEFVGEHDGRSRRCLLYTSPSPRDCS